MTFLLLATVTAGIATKPTVPLETSCDEASVIIVLKPASAKGSYNVLEVLYDGPGYGLKKDTEIALDLTLTFDTGQAYILFLTKDEKDKRFRAVNQMLTEDKKETRERVLRKTPASSAPRRGTRTKPSWPGPMAVRGPR